MKDFVYRAALKIFLPHLARSTEQDARSSLFNDEGRDYVAVEDRGADTTIFSFAGGAMLYAGMPAFEFRKMLAQAGGDCNRVFFRDASRLSYHLTPTGEPGGLEFYESEIRRIRDSLGSRRHIAIGGSAGAAAALYFGTRCGFDKIVAFSMPFPLRNWSDPRTQCHNLFSVPKLIREPNAYIENALLTLAVIWAEQQLRRQVGLENVWDPVETYLAEPDRPPVTLFYGERCRADARIAERLADIPQVKLVPLPVGLHNSAAYLKNRGELADAVAREFSTAPADALRDDTDRLGAARSDLHKPG